MADFSAIYQRAIKRKGGEAALLALLPTEVRSSAVLTEIPDHRYRSEMTEAIFKAGFVWKIIDNKWPGFEEAFWAFRSTLPKAEIALRPSEG